MLKYIRICPKYAHRYSLGGKMKNGFQLLREITDGVICSEDELDRRIEGQYGNNYNVDFSGELIRGENNF